MVVTHPSAVARTSMCAGVPNEGWGQLGGLRRQSRLVARAQRLARMVAIPSPTRQHSRLPTLFESSPVVDHWLSSVRGATPPLVERGNRRRHTIELPSRWWATHSSPERNRHSSRGGVGAELPRVPTSNNRHARREWRTANRGSRRHWCRCQDHRCADYRAARHDRRQCRGIGGCSGRCDSCRDSCANCWRRITYRQGLPRRELAGAVQPASGTRAVYAVVPRYTWRRLANDASNGAGGWLSRRRRPASGRF